nr:grp [Scylla serrata]
MRNVAWLWQALLAAVLFVLVVGSAAAIPAMEPAARVKRSPGYGGCSPRWACGGYG